MFEIVKNSHNKTNIVMDLMASYTEAFVVKIQVFFEVCLLATDSLATSGSARMDTLPREALPLSIGCLC